MIKWRKIKISTDENGRIIIDGGSQKIAFSSAKILIMSCIARLYAWSNWLISKDSKPTPSSDPVIISNFHFVGGRND